MCNRLKKEHKAFLTLLYDELYYDPLKVQSDIYKDIHHGEAFKMAHNKFCTEPYDVLIPIIPFIDGTPIDPYGRNKLEVVMYTLGIFNQQTRNKTDSWNIAGYIADPTSVQTGQNEKKDDPNKCKSTSKRTDYHAMLSYILRLH